MDIEIRPAERTDLVSVYTLSEGNYEGHDYLPFVFLRWLDEPNRRVFVAVKGETVIGLRSFHVVDDGLTVVSQGLRVHPEYRGLGVSTMLLEAQQKYIQNHFPNVKKERYTTMSNNVGRLAIHNKSSCERLLLELSIIAFYVDSKTLHSSLNIPDLNTRKLNFLEFQCFLRDGKFDGLLKNNMFVIDWEPFNSKEREVNCGLVKKDDVILVSACDGTPESSTKCLSHARFSERVKCPHWVATVYTTDINLLQAHIALQLKHSCEKATVMKKSFIFSCFLPTCFVTQAKQYVMGQFMLDYVDFFNFNLLLFEKDLSSL
ncbi:histidine N-acetyltransferase-like [Xenia sp. Carnegie-2017]|uniref:histidine N-acetyltransferase-like n=1 Tax=Xenia sp. Carnegie-2017 TaxID=2897299 RepID=UPI001F039CD9|nr:histidine N-acetyltransferase-like [Xenia sp. Carnegie-2017]